MAREEPHVVRMSARPPSKFSTSTDFSLWIQRFEIYLTEAGIPAEKRAKELLSLLDDASFRVVNQLGLVGSDDYDALKKQLQRHYSPEGNELEWQCRLQSRRQKSGESLSEYAGELRVMVDKAYPAWVAKQRLEMARNQFVQGLESASVQLLLMREKPETLDAALDLAQQQLSVESAQKRLHHQASQSHTLKSTQPLTLEAEAEEPPESNALGRRDRVHAHPQLGELSRQVQRLTEELDRLRADYDRPRLRRPPQQNPRQRSVGACWNCGLRGHLKRDCPELKRGERQQMLPRYQPPLN